MRRSLPSWFRFAAWILVFVMGLNAAAPRVYGNLVTSKPVATAAVLPTDLARVQHTLELKVVQQRLQDLGFTSDEVQQRLQRADPADLHQFAVQSDQLVAGSEGLGFVISVLIIVLLVMLILKLADKKIVIT